jgi:hypothetical protein
MRAINKAFAALSWAMFGNPWAAPSADTNTMAPPPRWTA